MILWVRNLGSAQPGYLAHLGPPLGWLRCFRGLDPFRHMSLILKNSSQDLCFWQQCCKRTRVENARHHES